MRQGHEHVPSVNLDLKPTGIFAVPYKAKNRFAVQESASVRIETHENSVEQEKPSIPQVDMALNPSQSNPQQSEMNKQFERAATEKQNDTSANGQGESGQSANNERFSPNTNNGNQKRRDV